jgi:endoglucanase
VHRAQQDKSVNRLRSLAAAIVCLLPASASFAACGAGAGFYQSSAPVMTVASSGTTGLDVTLDSGSSGYHLYVGNPSLWANLQPGGYVEYTIHAPVAGTYGLQVYYAAATNAGANVMVNGGPQSPLVMKSTGNWGNFAMSPAATITLPAGNSVVEIAAQAAFTPFNLQGMTITPIQVGGGVPAAGTSTATSGNYPLAGDKFYVSKYSQAASNIAASCAAFYPGSSGLVAKLAGVGQGNWFTGDATVQAEVTGTMQLAAGQQAVPILVAYNIPIRDCGGYSNGGATSAAAYQQWITEFAQGIGQAKAAVILEPDAVSQMSLSGCLSSAQITERESLLSFAVQTIESIAPKASVYIDAGHGDDDIPAATIASQLAASGVGNAAGFALNVANYVSTADNTTYGQQISALLNGKHFVIDTSRNGKATANGVWCNPPNQGAGTPTVGFSSGVIDGYLWVQNPGTSDGACNGMSYAGQWDLLQACQLGANASF